VPDAVTLARTARESLAQGLNALQADPHVPAQLVELAAPIAQAMGALHRIEASGGAQPAQNAQAALTSVQTALARSKRSRPRMRPSSGDGGGRGRAGERPRPGRAGSPSSPRRLLPQALRPQPQPQPQAYAPPQAGPRAAASAAGRMFAPAAAAYAPPQAYAPRRQQYAPPQQAYAQQAAAPQAPARSTSAAGPPPAGATPVAAELGAHSPSNFYKGLSGNDIVDHGGLFVSTYKLPKIGQPCAFASRSRAATSSRPTPSCAGAASRATRERRSARLRRAVHRDHGRGAAARVPLRAQPRADVPRRSLTQTLGFALRACGAACTRRLRVSSRALSFASASRAHLVPRLRARTRQRSEAAVEDDRDEALSHQLLLDGGRGRGARRDARREPIYEIASCRWWAGRRERDAKTEIVLTDQTDSANGSATALPYDAITLYVTAPGRHVAARRRGRLVPRARHARVHAHPAHRSHRGIPALINAHHRQDVRAQPGAAALAPRGARRLRGEHAKTSGGRLRSSMWNMWMRADVLENNVATLDVFSNTPRRWPQGNIWYLYGSFFMQWIAETYGEQAHPRDDRRLRRQLIPYGINRSIRRATGHTYEELYVAWVDSLKREYGRHPRAGCARASA
jgi:hypothetical protein